VNITTGGGLGMSLENDWEKPYLEMTKDFILSNTFAQIERGMTELGALGTRFEFECYDVGHLYNLAHFADRGLVQPPFFVQAIFGILGGIGPEPENLMHMKATADRLFGNDYYLSILAAAGISCRSSPWEPSSAVMHGWAWRIISIWARENSRHPMPTRSARSAASLRSFPSPSPRRTRRATRSKQKGRITPLSENCAANGVPPMSRQT
jgi:hypothetical protein